MGLARRLGRPSAREDKSSQRLLLETPSLISNGHPPSYRKTVGEASKDTISEANVEWVSRSSGQRAACYLNHRLRKCSATIVTNYLEFAGTAQGVRFWKEILGGEKGLSGHRTDCYVELGKRIIWQPQPIHRHIRMRMIIDALFHLTAWVVAETRKPSIFFHGTLLMHHRSIFYVLLLVTQLRPVLFSLGLEAFSSPLGILPDET